MVPFMRDNGKMANGTVLEWRPGAVGFTVENGRMVIRDVMEWDNPRHLLLGTKELGPKVCKMVTVPKHTQMGVSWKYFFPHSNFSIFEKLIQLCKANVYSTELNITKVFIFCQSLYVNNINSTELCIIKEFC